MRQIDELRQKKGRFHGMEPCGGSFANNKGGGFFCGLSILMSQIGNLMLDFDVVPPFKTFCRCPFLSLLAILSGLIDTSLQNVTYVTKCCATQCLKTTEKCLILQPTT